MSMHKVLPKSPSARFALKSGVVMLAMGILTACQSNQSNMQANTLATTGASHVFERYQKRSDSQAQEQLVKAMQAHLWSPRTSITDYYYQESPALTTDSLNQGADSIYLSYLKTKEYRTNQIINESQKTSVYRSVSDYIELGGGEEELYLRYYDEKAGTTPTPEYALTRADGMASATQAVDGQIIRVHKQYHNCIKKTSYLLDSEVRKQPDVTVADAAVTSILSNLDTCLAKAGSIQETISTVTPYQDQDLQILRQCASGYQRNIKDALAVGRKLSYQQEAYDEYDSVYGNYTACNTVFSAGFRSDPVVYMDYEYTKQRLEGLSAARQCALTTTAAQDELLAQNKSYKTHPEAYSQLFYQHMTCLKDTVADTVYANKAGTLDVLPPKSISSMEEARQMHDYYQAMLYGDEQEGTGELDYSYNKFSALGVWFDDYFKMREAELKDAHTAQDKDEAGDDWGIANSNWTKEIMEAIQRTPEQIAARNLYQYENGRLTLVSQYQPNAHRYQGVLSYEFNGTTSSQSVQLPISLDFAKSSATVDISAGLPLLALISSEHTPLPSDFDSRQGVINFNMPAHLRDVIPTSVVYEALLSGYLAGLKELDATAFSVVSTHNDDVARQLGASTVIKLNMTSKSYGEWLAIISKQMVKDLSANIDAHPELYTPTDVAQIEDVAESLQAKKRTEAAQKLKSAIHKWVLLDKGFISSDLGRVSQLIEAVLPLSMNEVRYFYLDHKGQLVGQVIKSDVDVDIANVKTQLLAVSSYRQADFKAHPLASKIISDTTPSLDGNAWLKNIMDERKFKKEAIWTRLEYHSSDEDAATAAVAEAAAAIAAMEATEDATTEATE